LLQAKENRTITSTVQPGVHGDVDESYRNAGLPCLARIQDHQLHRPAHSGELIEGGARVWAFDGSEEMIRLARQRVGEGVEIRQANLDQPLPYGDGSFDSVLCALAIHYAADRRATFREFFRVLRPGGRCVISTQHATTDWLCKGGSYFDVVLETDIWRVGGREQEVRYWREPLSELCAAATDAGFVIRQVIEPHPAESMRQAWPEEYAQLMQRPGFLMLDLLRLPEVGIPD
jgi:SAM-dependent methyltransferase